MPVYHKRMFVPKSRGEAYGPIDGVRPQDHLTTYNTLRHLRCCYTFGEVYEHVGTRGIKYCHRCYLDLRTMYRMNLLRIAFHTLVHERTAYIGQICLRCKKLLMRIKPAFECSDCIEEYLICNNRRFLNCEHRTVVTKRWVEP